MSDGKTARSLKWAESGLIPRLQNKRFNPEAVLKAAKANVSTRKPLGRLVNRNAIPKLTPAQQAAEDAGVAAVMAILDSDAICEAG